MNTRANATKQSGRGQPHSKTLSRESWANELRQVLECGCPLPLLRREAALGASRSGILPRLSLWTHAKTTLIATLTLLLQTTLGVAGTQPEILPAGEPPRIFSGGARTVPVMWRNVGDQPARLALSTRLYQASSATAAPLSKTPWKELTILPGQTVVESATLDFPAVRGETRFVVQWLQGSSNILGTTEVWVYPTNLLQELGALAGAEPVGLYDPLNQLKPLLKAMGVNCSDLEEQGTERFVGKLAIVGPFESKAQVREWLPESIRVLARKGVGVVWSLPPPEPYGKLKPSFYTVFEGKGAVVVVQAGVIAGLAEEPQAQLNLVQLCRLALKPETNQLPLFAAQP